MNELLALAVEAHGGMGRWDAISRFRAQASITGALWAEKGKPGVLHDVVLEGETRDQRLKIRPFPWPGRYATWEPYRQTIATDDGMLVAERRLPTASVVGSTARPPWDDLQVAYFAGEASWNCFASPFLFARADFVVEEGERWHEDGQIWRRLLVTYPDTVAAHCRQQTYYFDDDGLLRRLDYTVDILDGDRAVDYPSAYCMFDGIMVPTRRRIYVRNRDGSAPCHCASVAIDLADVSFA
jgi:hypothetical protein